MKRHISVPLLLAVALLVLLGVNSVAQEFRGRVQGLVTDQSQAIVPGANVTLTNVNTQVRTVRQTNDAGLYRFDNVDPGSYTVAIEASGFSRFLQENVLVRSQGDITVNAVLTPGQVTETVTISASPVEVQFNSTNVTLTIDTKLAEEIPRLDRNPFKLSLLNPAAIDTRRGEMMPYHSWAANSVELGGGTDKKNDLQVDGTTIGVGHKASYTPNVDSIQEVNVQQNAVDAEVGHSAGGSVSMTLKSGTNEYHGSVFYLGRNPSLNAIADRTTQTKNAERRNMWGGTIGHPILKGKLFNFFSYEQWKPRTPATTLLTVPTALEQQGDFSKTLGTTGLMKPIYDPWTTVFDAATGKATRTPFAGNKIPAQQFDPIAVRVMKGFGVYAPNRTPDSITGNNNYGSGTVGVWNYWNISDRVDWYVNDQWRVYGRVSRLHTMQTTEAPELIKSELYVPGGSARHAFSVSGDAIWTVNATTVVNFRGGYHSLVDDFASPAAELGDEGLGKIWTGSKWFAPFSGSGFPDYWPGITVGNSSLGRNGFWFQRPKGNSFSAKIAQQRGAHYVKAGFDTRRSGGISLVNTNRVRFYFRPAVTADTFLSPNTNLVGHEFATLLLGALNNDSIFNIKPIKKPRTEYYAAFIQDDWKVSRNITLNLGLRYEYDTPWHDPDHYMSRGLDLSQPITEMQQTPPQMPSQITSLMKAPFKYNGAWLFTDSSNPGIWKSQKLVLAPRVGLALRVNDQTAVRFGYSRFVTPSEYNFVSPPYAGFEAINFLEPAYMGYDAQQSPAPLLQGVPQAVFSDPFPASNPLLTPKGKAYGKYFGLGEDNITWAGQDFKRPVNDRLNLTLSRQLPNAIVAEITYFVNLGHDQLFSYDYNQVDPEIGYVNKGAVDANVANPFYQYLTPEKFPGPLRNLKTVAVKRLLREYPQYGGLWMSFRNGALNRYHSMQLKVQRGFRGGYNFLVGYNYRRERNSEYFDDIAAYKDQFELQESSNPRHSLSVAGTYELPFGKNRPFLKDMPRVAEAVIGGWQLAGAWYFNSGSYLRFGSMLASGDPALSNPTPQRWFDTSKFARLPAYTPRTNPKQYPDVKGPIYWEIQSTLSKTFRVTERVSTELKVATFNTTNRLNRVNPSTDVLSATFGQTLRQNISVGRQLEYSLKIHF
ncbi:MAG: carboxypeptidase regulatory-like domain-containing protein [Bryobacterales bacterium]|nr:carboxypeptidase regulatory-like domain-containing protein [Bryobacterales bacterium]